MADTEAGPVESDLRKPRHEFLDPSSKPLTDVEAFCSSSLKLLLSTKATVVRLHDNLIQFERCGKRCKLCRYLYAFFKDEIAEKKSQFELKEGPHVDAGISDLHIGEESKLVDRGRLIVSLIEQDPIVRYKTKSYGVRYFTLLSNGARGIERAVWSSPVPINFEARVPTISRWLSECINEHPKCRNTLDPNTPRAARVLEVLTKSAQPVLRLVATKELDPEDEKYAVLTHCWGGIEIDSKTTLANVEAYFTSIDIDLLPKTFREAIQIARAVNLRYLWIDSLCIIQQHPADWERESAKMASIFRGATLTISASTAENSTQGCGITAVLPPSTQFTLPSRDTDKQAQPFMAIRHTGLWADREIVMMYRDYPIHGRAWIFQEKILSRRILHATNGRFIFQCATHMESEDSIVYAYHNNMGGYDGTELLPSHVPEHIIRPEIRTDRGIVDIRKRWWEWMYEFALRRLTMPEDKHAALAGVTALYREITGDEPVLGLWKRDLVVHLAWEATLRRPDKVELAADSKFTRRPSWTWMSYPHGTVRPSTFKVDFEDIDRAITPKLLTSTRCYKAEVTGMDIRWKGRPLVTSPEHAVLKLRGLKHRLSRRRHTTDLNFHRDPGVEEAEDKDLYDVFALYASYNESMFYNRPDRLHTAYLAIEAVDGEDNVYRRIGRFMLYDPIEPEQTAEDRLFGNYEEIVLV